jgi:hypothetical protein
MIRYSMAGDYERSFRVSHTKSATAKINDARLALGIAERFFDEFAKDVNLLIEQEIDNAKFWAMVKSIVPEPQELEKGASEGIKSLATLELTSGLHLMLLTLMSYGLSQLAKMKELVMRDKQQVFLNKTAC